MKPGDQPLFAVSPHEHAHCDPVCSQPLQPTLRLCESKRHAPDPVPEPALRLPHEPKSTPTPTLQPVLTYEPSSIECGVEPSSTECGVEPSSIECGDEPEPN